MSGRSYHGSWWRCPIFDHSDVSSRPLEWAREAAEPSDKPAQLQALEVFGEHAADLLLAATAMGADHITAEEALQESFFAYYCVLKDGGVVHSARSWLLAEVRRSLLRRLPQSTGSGERLDLPDQIMARLEELLSPREVEVVRLRSRGLKYSEIADTLSIAIGTVGTLLGRALRKLHVRARLDRLR